MATEMPRTEFAKIMALLDLGTLAKSPSAKPSRPGEPSQLDAWYMQLRDLPAAALKAAVERFLAEAIGKDAWPTIAILRRFAKDHVHGVPLTPTAAWEAVQGVLRYWSFYRSREENKAIIDSLPEPARSVATQIGWRVLSDGKDQSSLRRDFCIQYAAAVERFSARRALPSHVRPRIDGAKPVAIEHRGTPKGPSQFAPAGLPAPGPTKLCTKEAARADPKPKAKKPRGTRAGRSSRRNE